MGDQKTLRELVREHADKSEQSAKLIRDMHFILMGNQEAGIEGLAQKVARHDSYIRKDKKYKNIFMGATIAANGGFWAWVKSHLGI